MIGAEKKPTEKLFYYNLNLEKRIPKDHILRRVAQVVDFGFVRKKVARFYGYNGHQSEDPIVLMKLMFLLFFENVKSERELMRTLPMRLDWLWFLGLDLDSEVPHHSVLSKARKRWGAAVFEELFVHVVRRCVEAGLVEGSKIHMDGSLVDADASQKSVISGGEELIEALKRSYGEQERKLEAVDEEKAAGEYQKKNRKLVSRTDPDAALVKQSRRSHSQPRYKNHRAVDDARGVITAVETTSGDVEENRELKSLYRQHARHTGVEADTVVADSQYGTNENFAWCGGRRVQAHMGDVVANRKSPVFGPDQFTWDEAEDCYWCPAGQALTRAQVKKSGKRKRWVYGAPATVCRNCELRSQCTRKQRGGRRLYRYARQEEMDRARAQSHSRQAYQDRLRRRHLMEGSFADAANNHHFKRSRWRRLERQRMQDYLIAACQNIRILLRYTPHQMAGVAVTAFSAVFALSTRLWRHLRARFLAFWVDSLSDQSNVPLSSATTGESI
jgi:transposase